MTRTVLEDFGGEMPAVPVDALPPAAAQESLNLFAGSREFRPLKGDVAVTGCGSDTRTLYRPQRAPGGGFYGVDNEAAGWLASATARSYVRGQINDDATERTYFTDSAPGTRPRAFDLSSIGAPRQLGVPPPAKIELAVVKERTPFLRQDAEKATVAVAEAVRDAIIECTTDPRGTVAQQRAARYKNFVPSGGVPGASTLTPRNGPQSNYGMGPTEEIASYLPESYRTQHATLWAVRPIGDLQALFGPAVVSKLGVVIAGVVAMPIVCMPLSYQPEAPDPAVAGRYLLETRLRAINNPKDSPPTPLFSEGELANLLETFVVGSRMATRVPELLRQLDDAVREFSDLVLNTPKPAPTVARPVEPIKPTVPQYIETIFQGGGGSDPGG